MTRDSGLGQSTPVDQDPIDAAIDAVLADMVSLARPVDLRARVLDRAGGPSRNAESGARTPLWRRPGSPGVGGRPAGIAGLGFKIAAAAAAVLVAALAWNRSAREPRRPENAAEQTAQVQPVQGSRPRAQVHGSTGARSTLDQGTSNLEPATRTRNLEPRTVNRDPLVSAAALELANQIPPLDTPQLDVPVLEPIVPLATADLSIAPIEIAPLDVDRSSIQ